MAEDAPYGPSSPATAAQAARSRSPAPSSILLAPPLPARARLLGLAGLGVAAGVACLAFGDDFHQLSGLGHWIASGNAQAMVTRPAVQEPAQSARSSAAAVFRPTETQWKSIAVDDLEPIPVRETLSTDGKIAFDEDHTTPVFSPYAGRIAKLLAKPGDKVDVGTPLLTIDAVDMVQAQNDLMAAAAALNKARSSALLAERTFARNKLLVASKAAALKDLQSAEDALTAARADLRTAEAGVQAARNRVFILGKSADDIEAITSQGRTSAETTVLAPIAGTIVQRKVGPGQFIASGASDPAFVIGDLSTVWLIAHVRETDASKVRVGQPLEFKTLAIPDRVFAAEVSYVASAMDPSTRRLMVRAAVANPDGLLKPEMFANVSIVTGTSGNAISVPRSALVAEAGGLCVWVARPDRSIELRKVEVGTGAGDRIQVRRGLSVGEKVIARSSLVGDRGFKVQN